MAPEPIGFNRFQLCPRLQKLELLIYDLSGKGPVRRYRVRRLTGASASLPAWATG